MIFYPDIAGNLLRNRLYQLPAYQINAKAFGFKGAFVPWEVGLTGGFARDDGCAHQEIHIAPDVSLFIRQYYQMTQNRSALKDFFPLLEGIADFIVSRVNRTDEQGWLSVQTIIGADESTGRDNVDNDVFSNACSVLALETTLDAADLLGIPTTHHQRASWRHAADKLKIGFFDGAHPMLHREYLLRQIFLLILSPFRSTDLFGGAGTTSIRMTTVRVGYIQVSAKPTPSCSASRCSSMRRTASGAGTRIRFGSMTSCIIRITSHQPAHI